MMVVEIEDESFVRLVEPAQPCIWCSTALAKDEHVVKTGVFNDSLDCAILKDLVRIKEEHNVRGRMAEGLVSSLKKWKRARQDLSTERSRYRLRSIGRTVVSDEQLDGDCLRAQSLETQPKGTG